MNWILFALLFSITQATFSIVAVDPETGEVGSAGASCIAGSIIISEIHPGVGAIHTQSYWNYTNQNNASDLMDDNYSPEEIIDYLIHNDSQNNPAIRQYGVVDMVDGGRSDAFTGSGCFDYKNHILGDTYAIQGNILIGQEVLDNMEYNFLNTDGPLENRLMSALQGANLPGADERCLEYSTSSLSAFIRLAKPTDTDEFFLDLNVNSVSNGVEPIDVLQELYDEWIIYSIEFTFGDINYDNMIDILDVVSIVNIVLSSEETPIETFLPADLNEDEIINIQDIIILVNIILN